MPDALPVTSPTVLQQRRHSSSDISFPRHREQSMKLTDKDGDGFGSAHITGHDHVTAVDSALGGCYRPDGDLTDRLRGYSGVEHESGCGVGCRVADWVSVDEVLVVEQLRVAEP